MKLAISIKTGIQTKKLFVVLCAVASLALAAVLAGVAQAHIPHEVPPGPAAPTNVTITSVSEDDSKVKLSFTATPITNLTYYQYSLNNGSWETVGIYVKGYWKFYRQRWMFLNPPDPPYNIRVRTMHYYWHWPHDDSLPGAVSLPGPPSETLTIQVPPGRTVLVSAQSGDGFVGLHWRAPNPWDTVDKFQYKLDSGDWMDIPGSSGRSRSHVVRGLDNGTSYDFSVRAIDKWNQKGAVSNVMSATPGEPSAPPPGGGE